MFTPTMFSRGRHTPSPNLLTRVADLKSLAPCRIVDTAGHQQSVTEIEIEFKIEISRRFVILVSQRGDM